jgi:hypothetical protein
VLDHIEGLPHIWFFAAAVDNIVEYRCACGAYKAELNPVWVREVRAELAEVLDGA